MKIISAINPVWADVGKTVINMTVELENLAVVQFSASANDNAAHGRDLFARAFAGEFGPVASMPAIPISQAKANKLAQLEQARDAAERANVTVAGKVYSASEAFQAKVSRAINQAGRGKPIAGANDAWRTADAQPAVMTTALLGLIEDAISAQGAAAWARFWQRFDAVQAATTSAAVNSVTW